MYRNRQLLKPNTEGGFCHHAVLHQAEPCGTDECRSPAPNDCVFEHWGQWSTCDAPCGKGTRERTRKVAVFATGDGRGCFILGVVGLVGLLSILRWRDQAQDPESTWFTLNEFQETLVTLYLYRPAKPLSLAFIVGSEMLVSSKNAVLRFAHVQRSKIIQVLDNAISAQASLGKRRAHGRQRPFDWRAPRWGATGLDIGAAIHAFLRRAFKGKEQLGYFLPDLLPERCTLQSATGFASRPMSLGRFGRLSQHLFQRAPFNLSSTEAADLTSYSARRVLPTLSELCRLDLREMLLVGDWKGARGEAADLNMPLRYPDQKLRASLCINAELVCVVRSVLNSDVQTRPVSAMASEELKVLLTRNGVHADATRINSTILQHRSQKDNVGQLARLKQARKEATGINDTRLIRLSQGPAEESIDEPLDPERRKSKHAIFQSFYQWTLKSREMVCDSLFGRIVREFESGQPTMFAVLRTRSLASSQRSQPSKKHRVTDNVQLSVGTPDDDISPLEDQGKLRAYFACFRTLGAGWPVAGCYDVQYKALLHALEEESDVWAVKPATGTSLPSGVQIASVGMTLAVAPAAYVQVHPADEHDPSRRGRVTGDPLSESSVIMTGGLCALPVAAACCPDRPWVPPKLICFSALEEDEELLAATAFPAGHNFGSLQDIGREELEAIVQTHPDCLFVVAYAGCQMPVSIAQPLVRILLPCLLDLTPSAVRWILTGFADGEVLSTSWKLCWVTASITQQLRCSVLAIVGAEDFLLKADEIYCLAVLPLRPLRACFYKASLRLASGSCRNREDGFAVTRRRLLPYGLPPTLRALLAESLHSPLASQAAVADALDFAIRMVVERGPGVRAWRQRQWRLIQRSLRQLSPLATFFEGQRAASAQRVGVGAHLIVGELPNFGIYRAKQQHTPPQDACFNTDRQWLEELLQSRPPPQHEAQLVFDKSQQERIHTASVDMGLAICQRFMDLIQQPLAGNLAFQAATKDMKGAYRYPASMVSIARRWLAIPVINFFDDFKITEPVFAKGSGSGNSAAVSQQLFHSLQFHHALLQLKPYREVTLTPDGKAFGPLVAIHFHKAGKSDDIFFIDNLGVLAAMIVGSIALREHQFPAWPQDVMRVESGMWQLRRSMVEGEWSEWSGWTDCSATCGTAYKSRRRDVAVQPSHCGKPAVGLREEYKACIDMPECNIVQDCIMGQWNHWSQCSCSCFGIRERNRVIERFATAGGESCNGTVKEVVPCNPGIGREPSDQCGRNRRRQDCVMSDWEQWGKCSATCGGGQTERSRHIVLASANGGTPCSGELAEIERRGVTGEVAPNAVVRGFDFATSSRCQIIAEGLSAVCQYNCVVSESCDKCGTTSMTRNRALGLTGYSNDFLFMASDEASCAGTQLNVSACPTTEKCQKCVPENCVFAAWSDWHDPTCLGLCERHRVISQHNNNCGTGCQGPTLETKTCPVVCQKEQDCQFGEWSAWEGRKRCYVPQIPRAGPLLEIEPCPGADESCRSSGKEDCQWASWAQWSHCGVDGQMSRKRTIARLPSVFGEPCTGPLFETASCDSERVDCDVSPWSAWDACDRSCDGGQMHRHREVHRYPSGGGADCPSILIETRGCNSQSCSGHDCRVSEWESWGFCSTTCGVGQRTRRRQILGLRGIDGHGCYEALGEVQACSNEVECEERDCVWGEWAAWSYCSRSCDGGIRSRKRQILRVPSKHGRQCDAEIKETVQPCNTHTCTTAECSDGLWSHWSDWSPCSVSCDRGTTFRTRHVAKTASECGSFPAGLSSETRICEVSAPCVPDRDCVFGEWSAWGPCSAHCDGTQERSRAVKHFGLGHGSWCSGATKELRPCNPKLGHDRPAGCQEDHPVDCIVGEWAHWSRCTAVCDGGVQRRTRVVVQRASHGGRGCLSALSEVQECNRHLCSGGNMPVDCEVGQWQEWGLCSKCDGEITRFRTILRYASNGGRPCDHMAVREVGKCPRACSSNLYCTWAGWQDWGECSKTCGRGGKRRRRRYLHLSHDAGAKLLPGGPGAPGQGGVPPGPGVSNGGYPTLEEFTTRASTTTIVPPAPLPMQVPMPTLPGMTVSSVSAEYEVMFQRSKDVDKCVLHDNAVCMCTFGNMQEMESTHVKDLLLSFAGGFLSPDLDDHQSFNECMKLSQIKELVQADHLGGALSWQLVSAGQELPLAFTSQKPVASLAEDANSAPVYEWGCPFQGEWTENRYESGPGDDQCTDEGDCICIARGSPNMHTELESGHEKIIGRFETESGKANLGHEPQLINVIPHYFLRTKDGAPFDIENPHSGLGVVKEFDREEWLLKYKEEAPKIQGALDKLRAAIDAQYRSKVQDGGPFVCDGTQAPGEEPSLTKAETQLGLMRVRRFQVLAADCVNMQDTAAKLAGRPEEESFAPSGKTEGGDELKCYRKKDSAECQQLNCYRGFEDQGFLDRLQLYKSQLDSCSPEEDTKTEREAAAGTDGAEGQAEATKELTKQAEATKELTPEESAEGKETEESTGGKETEELAEGKEQSMECALLGAVFGRASHVARTEKAERRSRQAEFL
ncbi:HMCN1 [Symbiodinium pilosum]|uniref:HMCN1 protein n=1 Tax=Symbiodinium pilosum TaxID=2952 RepID=A0A812YKJ5_SYMPI|nr:HMCN1 [Symbiodinium pilosum]